MPAVAVVACRFDEGNAASSRDAELAWGCGGEEDVGRVMVDRRRRGRKKQQRQERCPESNNFFFCASLLFPFLPLLDPQSSPEVQINWGRLRIWAAGRPRNMPRPHPRDTLISRFGRWRWQSLKPVTAASQQEEARLSMFGLQRKPLFGATRVCFAFFPLVSFFAAIGNQLHLLTAEP